MNNNDRLRELNENVRFLSKVFYGSIGLILLAASVALFLVGLNEATGWLE